LKIGAFFLSLFGYMKVAKRLVVAFPITEN